MSRLQVFTEKPGGGDRIYLDELGQVAGLRFSTSRQGDLAAAWEMQLGVRRTHRAVSPGRIVRIPCGAGKGWSGILGRPRRGDVWSFTAQGAPWLADTFVADAPSSGNALDLDEVVDEAIGRGLPWSRPSALPTVTDGRQTSGAGQVGDSLATVAEAKNKVWRISRAGAVSMVPMRPTNVAYLLQASDTAGGRSVLGFVTDVVVTYLNGATYEVASLTRSAAARPYGRFEQPLDLTSMGPISTSQAQDHGDAWLARRGVRMGFTAPFTVTPGQMLSWGGVAVDLATVQASDGLVRVLLTDPDSAAGETATGMVHVTPGETEYDVDADVLRLTPFDHVRTGLAAVFS